MSTFLLSLTERPRLLDLYVRNRMAELDLELDSNEGNN